MSINRRKVWVERPRRRGSRSGQLPPQTLSAIFGVPAETFAKFRKFDNAITILRAR